MDMQLVESTSIEAIGYDATTQELHVRFISGRQYRYFGVDEARHRELVAAPSIGAYFNKHVRPHYRCEER